jgi:hypothetical protein
MILGLMKIFYGKGFHAKAGSRKDAKEERKERKGKIGPQGLQ